ncbi:MAG: GTP-binding protein [Candidatus Heimdallarchaeota archaeon]|nr:MAG: GTP-binding protein [Candidatus Heimdallarchaeota archaeon]
MNSSSSQEETQISLLKRLFRRLEKKEEDPSPAKQESQLITFIGEAYAGKTTILHRLRTGEFYSTTIRTMGLNVDSFEYRNVQFQAFDLGGQESFHMLWGDYLRLSSAVVFVVDCANPDSFASSKAALYNAMPSIPENAVLLIAANKADISGVDPYVTLLKHFDLYDIQQNGNFRAINIFHMSAKSGVNFYQAFDWLIETLTGEIILPNVHIHNICIYQTDSGLLVGSSASTHGQTHYDPALLTSMFSAVNTFAEASMGAGVREILMKRSQEGVSEVSDNYKLVRVEESDFSVILIVNETDSMRKSVQIGKDLLIWTRLKIPDPDTLYDQIEGAEIKNYLETKFPEDMAKVQA